MLVDLVRTTTPDGMRLDGALHAATKTHPAFDLAICLHGVMSNFYSSSLMEGLVEPFTSRGIAVLRVNTRGHDSVTPAIMNKGRRWQGAAFELIDECRQDVLGWHAWAAERGFERVLLLGHSLGGVKVLYAAAKETLPLVRGVAALSPPRLSYTHFRQDFENSAFFESIAAAEQLMVQRSPDTLFQARYPLPLFITASGYLDKYGPLERYNFLKFLNRISVPVVFTFGEKEFEHLPFHGIREAIADRSHEHCHVHTITAADHAYTGRHVELAEHLVGWIESL
jgi:pimeloyl-ACP methyl ester carboxylesterase